jgi:NAD+ kinase
MSEAKRSFLVMLRTGDQAGRDLGQKVSAWLGERGVAATLCEHDVCGGLDACQKPQGDPWDMALVLGGDGTFIGVSRACLRLGLPVLGLNLGRVGFLAEDAANWPDRLDALLSGAYRVSRRLCLSFRVVRNGAEAASGLAVNDIVVSRGDMARLIRLSVTRGEEPVGAMRADGLILSTPTGSTAYGNSAGGPLVYPELEAFCLTPVCPFLNTFSPMVLPPDQELRIDVEERRAEVRLTVDGQRSFALAPGDEIRVVRHPQPLQVVLTDSESYFTKLSRKGFFTQR